MIIQYIVSGLTILSFLGGVLVLFYKIGKSEQRMTSALELLEAGRQANREKIDEILETIRRHIESGSHVNPVAEARAYEENRDWKKGVDDKLNQLVRGVK